MSVNSTKSVWEDVWNYLENTYEVAIEERMDARTKDWFMVHSPWPPAVILVLYIAFCANAKTLMKGRKPFQINALLKVYNLVLVCLSVYMVYEFFMSSYLASYSLLCQPVDYSTSPLAMRMAKVCWWYFISKYFELLDTVFFVMRKKFNQVSFLHVFHHSTMLINWWLAIKYTAGGQAFFIGLINSFVHVIMYSYYALCCFGPEVRKYLWWKKYLTRLQLIQFVCIFTHCVYNYFADCEFPDWLNLMVISYMVALISLFTNFYVQSYLTAKGSKKQK